MKTRDVTAQENPEDKHHLTAIEHSQDKNKNKFLCGSNNPTNV